MKVRLGRYKKNNNRTIDVEIENFDVWGLDHSLALIILPALIHLKEVKHGVPSEFATVGGEDYAEQLSFDFYYETNRAAFDTGIARWDDILDKMIWSFQQIVIGDWEDQYMYGDIAFSWKKKGELVLNPLTQKQEPVWEATNTSPREFWSDRAGMEKHQERIQEGLELFGKYYQHLWD